MFRSPKVLFLGIFMVATAALTACGGNDDPDACDDILCLEGTHCIVQDSGPACVPD